MIKIMQSPKKVISSQVFKSQSFYYFNHINFFFHCFCISFFALSVTFSISSDSIPIFSSSIATLSIPFSPYILFICFTVFCIITPSIFTNLSISSNSSSVSVYLVARNNNKFLMSFNLSLFTVLI